MFKQLTFLLLLECCDPIEYTLKGADIGPACLTFSLICGRCTRHLLRNSSHSVRYSICAQFSQLIDWYPCHVWLWGAMCASCVLYRHQFKAATGCDRFGCKEVLSHSKRPSLVDVYLRDYIHMPWLLSDLHECLLKNDAFNRSVGRK